MEEFARVVAPELMDPDERVGETRLRPQRLAEYIGQGTVKENLSILIEAAKGR
jgi:Holliday junction DNA helicase RuvB